MSFESGGNRSEWTSEHEWRDPDCIECGGEGAPCCEPPDHPYSEYVAAQGDLDRLADM